MLSFGYNNKGLKDRLLEYFTFEKSDSKNLKKVKNKEEEI